MREASGKLIGTKKIVDDALKHAQMSRTAWSTSARVLGSPGPRAVIGGGTRVEKWPAYIAPEPMNSEDPLFCSIPQGLGQAQGGDALHRGLPRRCCLHRKYVFDIHDSDKFFCGGDVGWITGHTYVVYAPLLLGLQPSSLREPCLPRFLQIWEVVAKHEVTQFYVAPTALRLLKRAGDKYVKHEMKHLRVLGSSESQSLRKCGNGILKSLEGGSSCR